MTSLVLQQELNSSVDKTRKLIYVLHRESGAVTIEVGVINKDDGKGILCVPTQTNCAQACRFCHTTLLAGKVAVANLTPQEIETIVRDSYRDSGLAALPLPLLVSFMGMGEPMANAENLLNAIVRLELWAYAVKLPIRFALATMLPDKHLSNFAIFMTRVTYLRLPIKVHFSMHYTTDLERKQWMPAAAQLAVSLSLLAEYKRRTGNPVEIHYTLIQGVNDFIGDAMRLRGWLRDTQLPVKFLNFNPVPGDTNRPPDRSWVTSFRTNLEAVGIPTEWYDSPGADIAASCGMFEADAYIPTKRVAEFVQVDRESRFNSIDVTELRQVAKPRVVLP